MKPRKDFIEFLLATLFALLIIFFGYSTYTAFGQTTGSVMKTNPLFSTVDPKFFSGTQQQNDMTILYGRLDSVSKQLRDIENRLVILQLKCVK